MSSIDPALRDFVRLRAAGLCEYCRISERKTLAGHEIDHVIAAKHGGHQSGRLKPLFNPRVTTGMIMIDFESEKSSA